MNWNTVDGSIYHATTRYENGARYTIEADENRWRITRHTGIGYTHRAMPMGSRPTLEAAQRLAAAFGGYWYKRDKRARYHRETERNGRAACGADISRSGWVWTPDNGGMPGLCKRCLSIPRKR